MSRKSSTECSVNQRLGNAAREHKLIRIDTFVAYVMDRLLYRLGRSAQADEFYLKGGVLVANLVDDPTASPATSTSCGGRVRPTPTRSASGSRPSSQSRRTTASCSGRCGLHGPSATRTTTTR